MGTALSGRHVDPEREVEHLTRPLVSPNRQPIAKDHSALRQKSERIRVATDGDPPDRFLPQPSFTGVRN